MRRILIVLDARGARPSGLVRGLIYRNLFVQNGFEVRYVSHHLPWIIELWRSPNRLMNWLIGAGLGYFLAVLDKLVSRLSEAHIVRIAQKYDVVYLLKVDSYRLVSNLRRSAQVQLVFDLNDALWLPRSVGFASERLLDILHAVDAVTCDNKYVAAFARQHNEKVYIVPDPPQVEMFDQYRDKVKRNTERLVLGWIGSPDTTFNLYAIWEPLERLFEKHDNLCLRLIGVGRNPMLLPRFEKVRFSVLPYYSQIEMIKEVLGMDIGLFPLFDIEDSLARGILKATVYMSGGAALICSGIGECRSLVTDGVNGMLANSAKEWLEKIELLIENAELRQRIARQGLETIRQRYRLEQCFAKLIGALVGVSLDNRKDLQCPIA